ncbi:putative disease resistance protein RGA1 [Cajanus cajan]|uniref:putative disease resistance protein RGA1 n=1 Tax=Cajanus cajan TaxID=3821 RepID=UPI0010FAEBF4|nr:putative disease resistance protein RGA1 [Cajanus cajan]
MAEALLGIVIENLRSFVQDDLATILGVDQQIQKLSSYLTAIRAVLEDAEKKQITSNAVKDWLQKLTDAAYVLDDILDECSIHSKSSCLSRVHPKDILFRRDVGKRMKDITQRFHDIHEERSMFQLSTGVTDKQGEDVDQWRQTSSVITEPIIYGRDQDREQIVEFLLGHASNSQDLSIYTIVGMGGLGKTTLAKQVFNDARVSKHFDLTIWVCVSNNFNMKTILQAIIEYTTGQNPNLNTLEAMRKKVQEVLQSKRYLLVLDDVWNEDQGKWKELKGVLQCARGTILVTTRLEQVASIMEAFRVHRLIELSYDDSWLLFKHHAFGYDREESEELVEIGKYIVRKCVGSPLAIKTLGSLLRGESEVQQWQNIKESEIWDIKEESCLTSGENSILRALKLSYVNLDLSLRRCFSFCAIFPKGSAIVKEELIHLWMANGFIKPEGNLEVDDVGHKVWKKLYGRSFFQEAKSDEFGIITSFKMHDLFHDLAQFVVGEECVVYKVHHLNLLERNESESVNKASLDRVESLRTFLDDSYWYKKNVPLLPLNNSLRALKISSRQVSPVMDLTHLRYLNLHGSYVICLPRSICRLEKLQILKLEECHNLLRLPKHLTQLQDLRHIVINRCVSLLVTPPKMGKLRHLRTLSSFIVGSKSGYGLEELHGLKLGGKLHIKGLENVPSEGNAKEANLISKRELNRLYLSWGHSEGSNVNAERVLEGLEPPSTLKSFGMNGYKGIQLSRWMRNPWVLKDLVNVLLYKCVNCKELPPLGKLAHLKRLYIYGMKDVNYIDSESYDGVEEKAFPSLETFVMEDLPNLERILRDEEVEMLPRLWELSIKGVPKLQFPSLPSVEKFRAREIENEGSFMEGVVGNLPCLKSLSIVSFSKLKVLPEQLGRLGALEELVIEYCDELESFPEHVLQGLTCLRRLRVYGCKKLKWLCEGLGHLACLEDFCVLNCPEVVTLPSNMNQLTALREVTISGTLLECFQGIPSLQRLYLSECSSLPEWVGDMTSLKELQISGNRELRSLPSSIGKLTNLSVLMIYNCSELTSLPSSIQYLTNLSELYIDCCPQLEKRCKRETGKDWQYIAHIPHQGVVSFSNREPTYYDRIQSLWTACNTTGMRSAIHFWQHNTPIDQFDRIVEWDWW